MGADKMKATAIGSVIELSRDQWTGHKAYISDYPGLLEAVQKYTWTYSGGEHPYLRSSKLKTSLHKFVLAFLYGADNLEKMLLPDNIIEHLDNNGLNCAYDNLHILSSDRNKGKAFLIDKEADKFHGIPLFITDVFYSHNRQYYQMQVTFNYDLYFDVRSLRPIPIEAFFFQYGSFNNLFIDWLYVFECRESGVVDIRKFHADRVFAKYRPQTVIKPEEQDHVIIQRDGQCYIRLCTDPEKGLSIISKTGYENLENTELPPKEAI